MSVRGMSVRLARKTRANAIAKPDAIAIPNGGKMLLNQVNVVQANWIPKPVSAASVIATQATNPT